MLDLALFAKLIGGAAAGVGGILSVFTDTRKPGGRLTRAGLACLVTLIAGSLLALIATYVDDRNQAQEVAEQIDVAQDIARSLDDAREDLFRQQIPIDEPTVLGELFLPLDLNASRQLKEFVDAKLAAVDPEELRLAIASGEYGLWDREYHDDWPAETVADLEGTLASNNLKLQLIITPPENDPRRNYRVAILMDPIIQWINVDPSGDHVILYCEWTPRRSGQVGWLTHLLDLCEARIELIRGFESDYLVPDPAFDRVRIVDAAIQFGDGHRLEALPVPAEQTVGTSLIDRVLPGDGAELAQQLSTWIDQLPRP